MGGHLEEMYPGEMVVFGFATGEGTYTAMEQGKGLKSDNVLQKPPAGSVEAHLDAAGKPVLLLDVRGASVEQAATKWAARPTAMRSIGAIAMQQQFYPQNPVKSYDILVYIKTSTASRLINR
jgi:erythromycin esterase